MPTTSETEPTTITYYVETTDGFYRFNVPSTWSVKMEFSRERGTSFVVVEDDNANDRLFFSGVQQLRDSSTVIQSLTPSEQTPLEDGSLPAPTFEFRTIVPSEPNSLYTYEALTSQSRRRRRIQLQEDSIDSYDEGYADPY